MATVLSQVVGGVIPLIYFVRNRQGVLYLSRTTFDGGALLQTCVNGSSEMMTNLSLSLVNILYNFQLMRFAGENGVAAYGVIMYVNFIFISAYLGYSIGVAPVVSFHFGARNGAEVKNLLGKSLKLLSVGAVTMAVLGSLLAGPL
ncbi:MAG: hypothetical protein II371_08210, partial [Flavobacteriales bacterium]|nr:hypothetical protein [Flavobacteriales bacterium]